MATYCECGDVATVFYDDDGNEIEEPCCEECFVWQQMLVEEMFGSEEQAAKAAEGG